MGTFIWMMASILLLAITIFVHRHTRDFCSEDRLKFPIWLLLSMIVIAIIPVVNLAVFVVGVIVYLLNIAYCNIEFHCNPKWLKPFVNFLCKEI